MMAERTTRGVAAGYHLDFDGFQILPEFLSAAECESLAAELTTVFESQQEAARGKIGGVRDLFRRCPRVAGLAVSPKFISVLEDLTDRKVFPVRAIFFDKTPGANWRVPWHQDLTIAVNERLETPGFNGWSVKEEIMHVQPPVGVLEGMVTLRLHLDATDLGNGALKVIPGSHRHGRLAAAEIRDWSEGQSQVVCEIRRGGAMVMRPLLLHASSPSTSPWHRRVLHLEYSTEALPNGLEWFDR